MSTKQVELKNREMPQDFKKTGQRLFRLLLEQKRRFVVIVISAIFFATLMAITPLILGWGLDAIVALLRADEITTANLRRVLWQPVLLLFLAWGGYCAILTFARIHHGKRSRNINITLTKTIDTKDESFTDQIF